MNETARTVPGRTVTARTVAGYGLPIAWIFGLVLLYGRLSPVARFLGATVGLLFSIKAGSWLLVRDGDYSLSLPQTVLFWTVWPGVRPDLFAGAPDHDAPDAQAFLEAYAAVVVGVLLALAAILAPPYVGVGASTWLLLFALLSIVHLGVGRILPFGLRWAGYSVPPLFRDPIRATGVGDFWSDRWNRPFVNMNRLFLTRPLADRIGIAAAAFLAFLVSGILHELAISYSAGAGWGLPTLYFVIQGVLYTVEQQWFPEPEDGGRTVLRRLWTAAAVLGPLPLLFHAPFRTTFLAPLIEGARSLLLTYPLETYVAAGLWIGAAGHFLVLFASYRVPEELDWDTDLQSLRPLNRKLMWTYGGYVVLMIVAFGVMTVAFHEQFLNGDPVALGVAGLIVVFWTVRIVVDVVYFDHDDWPEGLEFVVGHALLTSLFLLLVVIYAGTVAFHLL